MGRKTEEEVRFGKKRKIEKRKERKEKKAKRAKGAKREGGWKSTHQVRKNLIQLNAGEAPSA